MDLCWVWHSWLVISHVAVGAFLSSGSLSPYLPPCARAKPNASFARSFLKFISFFPPSFPILSSFWMAGVPSPLLVSCLVYFGIPRLLCSFSINGPAHQGWANISQTHVVLFVSQQTELTQSNSSPTIFIFTYGAWSININEWMNEWELKCFVMFSFSLISWISN